MSIRFGKSAVRTKLRRMLLPAVALLTLSLSGVQSSFADGATVFNAVSGNPPAPKLKLLDMDGHAVNLEKLRGRPVLINFWATWCPPCRKEMPSLQRLWKKLGNSGLQIVAVNVAEDEDTILGFIGTLDDVPTFPILFDKDSAVMRAWPVKGMPTTFLVNKDGRIVYRAIGGRDFDSPESLRVIKKLLADQNATRGTAEN